MKKILSVLMVFALCISVCACIDIDNVNTAVCPYCGGVNPENVRYCSNCSEALNTEENDNTTTVFTESDNKDMTEVSTSETVATTDNTTSNATINTAKDFLNNIVDGATIVLGETTLNFKNIYGINNPNVVKQGDGYTIKNVKNLTIQGNATILIDAIMDILLSFENCENIILKDLSFNCTSYDENAMIWYLSFSDCTNITIDNCTFKNAHNAVDFANCKKTVIDKCMFENIHYGAVSPWFTDTTVKESVFKNCDYPFSCREAVFNINNCNIFGVKSSNLIEDQTEDFFEQIEYSESEITFSNCSFENNALYSFFAKEESFENVYEHSKLRFNNCDFKNNLYCYGNLTTNNFQNCTFVNNTVGIEIPDITGWSYDKDCLEFISDDLNGASYSIEYSSSENDLELFSQYEIIAQSKSGVVSKSEANVVLTISKPTLSIDSIYWDINYANGVEPTIEITNESNKQIAYIYITVKCYDRMGSPAYCSIKDTSTQRLKITGPINAGVEKSYSWDAIIYNSTVGAIKPISVEIEFTDGTKQTLTNEFGIFWSSNSYYGGDLRD